MVVQDLSADGEPAPQQGVILAKTLRPAQHDMGGIPGFRMTASQRRKRSVVSRQQRCGEGTRRGFVRGAEIGKTQDFLVWLTAEDC
jgi:hypothetical protein